MNILHFIARVSAVPAPGTLPILARFRVIRKSGSQDPLGAYVVVSLLAGVRTEEARALTWADVDLEATVAVYRSVRAKGDTQTRKSRRLLNCPDRQSRHSGSTASGRPPNGSRRAGNGRTTTWSSAASAALRWTAGRSAASSPSSPRLPG